MAEEQLTEEQKEAELARSRATEDVFQHSSDKKIVVAGPGTGKTHLFKKIFEGKTGEKLTLTFINALVEDLSLELNGISTVRTLHGFALSLLGEDKVRIFTKLPTVIRTDAKIILGRDINFEEKIHNIDESLGDLDFYSSRRKYYDHFSHSDIILGVVKVFQADAGKIPAYSQIVVDEFQDFNFLEVTLIEILASKSPVVIAGDDDQAIYHFKSADPRFIRLIHGDKRPDFTSFQLPFCSRSTKVIVSAINKLIETATRNGFLNGRVDKPYIYFPSPSKDKESESYPKIIQHRLEDAQIAWYVESQIEKLANELRKEFSVLVICQYKGQYEKIGRALTRKGFTNVNYKETTDSNELSYSDGLKLLTKGRINTAESNLGWRVASSFMIREEPFEDIVKESHNNSSLKFRDLVPKEIREIIEADVKILKKIEEGEPVDDGAASDLLRRCGLDPGVVKTDFIKEKFRMEKPSKQCNPGVKKFLLLRLLYRVLKASRQTMFL